MTVTKEGGGEKLLRRIGGHGRHPGSIFDYERFCWVFFKIFLRIYLFNLFHVVKGLASISFTEFFSFFFGI